MAGATFLNELCLEGREASPRLPPDNDFTQNLNLESNVEDSLVTNAGQITGAITPVITVSAVSASEEVGEITISQATSFPPPQVRS